jgi:hypothetical protein
MADAVTVPQTDVTVYVMVEVPAETPVTAPVVVFTVAAEVLLLVHVPPLTPSLDKVLIDPVQRNVVPFTVPAFGSGLTVTA